MIDRQIIIDGVDVSGCFFYKENGECTASTIWADYCKACSDCIYKLKKQLKAKEQECEELKVKNNLHLELKTEALKQAEFVRTLNTVQDAEIRKLQKENEKLKAEIKLSKEMLIQNTSETNKYTIPQIIEQFISDNYIDQQNDDGYTIPIFLQLEDILYEKESLEEKLGLAETTKGLQRIEIEQLKQTLTEIKEIANKTLWTYSDLDDVTKYNMFDKILQKISECEVEDEN